MLLRILSIVFPMFAIIAAGYAYGRRHRPDMAVANQLNMDIFMPALVFAALAGKTYTFADYGALALGGAVVMFGSGLLCWPLVRPLRTQARTFALTMVFKNSGNMGIPLVLLAFGEEALFAAVLLFLVENLLHFTVGAYILDHRTRFADVLRTPVVMAALAGVAVSVSGLALWPPLLIAMKMLGDVSIPLLLFAMGVRLFDADLRDWRLGAAGAVAGPLTGVAVAWGAARLLGLDEAQSRILFLFGALPPAVLNYIFAERYRQEPEKVASLVFIGNLGALVSIPLALLAVLE